MIKPPKNANHELPVFTVPADPVKTDPDDAVIVGAVTVGAVTDTVTPAVLPPGRTQVHVCAVGQLVGPTVPTHVVVWPVQVSMGHVVRVWRTVTVSPGRVCPFSSIAPSVMPTDEKGGSSKLCFKYGLENVPDA